MTPFIAIVSRRGTLLLGALLASLMLAPGTWAQGGKDDPIVDPDSPAGREYELPIDRAREDARGPRTDRPAGDSEQRQTPLFGEGVEPGGPSKQGASGRSSGKSAPDGASRDSGSLGESEPEVETLRGQASPPGGDSDAAIAIGAGGAGVLLIGGLAGLVWRRRRIAD